MQKKTLSPLQAIRVKCLDCSGGSALEARECWARTCALHPFRLGKNPNITPRKLTEEQKSAARERLAQARAAKQAE